ncbi:hypothetical protein ALP26_01760 [Pseudomonas savastanoi pv. glycinea]|uniref:Uncharacterized protein n=3 Tax=Pseudomonas savastanoi pv. glycinea TaxID=318 RepID=A0A0P9RV25_PSESG|nr:hypothetical protein PsgB076_13757 [Pseudomonas savastanoi pv. glycinea str. B076]EFW84719.1 hypothetical protein PsgRace4_17858 [Pseudomonas savastanoi pv. glycinea str. race 4]KPX50042.1 hypothetical protein ALO37_102749 [Pseudomonas savastanoi pv. glycinea]PYD21857.1 hypothetical protein DND36_16915 [Pseudomonas savastanoi pv. glycinea]RMM97223.1 hypothetical protein ALQ67_00631 [Pseudomonas savastanoi pv. glycinea]
MSCNCSEFEELGISTPLECWRQQAHLLASEVSDLQADLSITRRNLHKLIAMHDGVVKERNALSLELTKVKWQLSDAKLEQSRLSASTLNAFSAAYKGQG